MPQMDGHEALKTVRQIEKGYGIDGLDRVKVIMTTAVGTKESVITAFNSGCESYLIKPIRKEILFAEIEKLGLLS